MGAGESAIADEKLLHSLLEKTVSRDQLFELARNKSAEGRKALLVTISDLFFNSHKILSDRERMLMGEILRALVHEIEMSVRRQLAERMATLEDVPHDLIFALANDEVEVAHPILLNSDVLQDVDLIEIIRHRTMQHRLAIAMRKEVSAEVSKVLVDSGEEDVVAALLENHGAVISREVMEYLVAESKRVDRYQNPLVHRPDLPKDLAQRLYWWVSAALRKHIVEHFSIDPTKLDDEIESVTQQVIGAEDKEQREEDERAALVQRLSDLGELTPQFLIKTLRQGEIPLFEEGLARLSGLRLKLVRRILYETGGEGLAILCKALGQDRHVFLTIFELTRRALDRGEAVASEKLEEAASLFDRTKQVDANRVLKRWQRSSEFLYALKRTGQDI
jgi:uncharacterized protein (DUF2336 family)